MIQSSHKLLGALLLGAAIGVGCHRAESDNPVARPPVDYALLPIDLLLKFEQNDGDQSPQYSPAAPELHSDERSEGQSFYVTSGVTTKMTSGNYGKCRDFNIFLFHKTRDSIVRHYYVPIYMPQILLSNLYVGDYRLYIIANNGRICDHPSHWECPHRHTDMNDLMSSIIPLPEKSIDSYYGLMVYSDTAFRILREDQKLEVKLKQLASKISLNIRSTLPSSPDYGATEYLKFENYSIINMPRRTKLFGDYRPTWQDVGQVTSYPITSPQFIVLNNLQGDGSTAGSTDPKDRNSFKAPQNATCLRIYATYYIKDSTLRNISYLVYLGGEEVNNYDMQAGVEYNYTINFTRPDLDDPRVTSFTVPDEDKKFENAGGGSKDKFTLGEVISRPLTVEYSKLFASDTLYISCLNMCVPTITKYKYTIYATVNGIETLLCEGNTGEPVTLIPVPTAAIYASMHQAKMRIEYTQEEASRTTLALMLQTKNGQQYDVSTQIVNYNQY